MAIFAEPASSVSPALASASRLGLAPPRGALLLCARVARLVGIDVEWPRDALDAFFRDHDLLDTFEARQIEHGVEQDTFHDRAQSARSGLAVDGVAGDGAERLLRQSKIDRFHLEQPLVLRMRASVCANSVLPEPVGPISRMLDFASSTSLC